MLTARHAVALKDAADNQAPLGWTWTLPRIWNDEDPRLLTSNRSTPLDVRCAGVIFDRSVLALDLGLPATVDDGMLIAAGYARWSLDLFARLRGAFAIAICDRSTQRVILARDHLGLHPLFYAMDSHRILAGSAAPAVARLPGVSRDLNRVALADALCRRFPDVEETFFSAVKRVPPASFLIATRDGATVHRYWNPLENSTPSARSEDEAYEQFVHLQQQAVRRTAIDRSAIFLSGGLDSTSIATAAAALCAAEGKTSPLALSLTFPGTGCDERSIQAGVAQALGMPACTLTFDAAVGERNLVDQAGELSARLSSPLQNFWRPAYMALARQGRARGARVILTGDGGDEWMVPSPTVTADLIRGGRLLALRQFVQAWNRAEDGRGLLRHCGLRPLASAALARLCPHTWNGRRADRVAASDPAWIAPDAGVRTAQRARVHRVLPYTDASRSFHATDLEAGLQGAGTQHILEESFEQGQLLGMTLHHPYHDPEIVDFFCRLPLHLANSGGWIRGLTRRQLARRFPDLGFDRQVKMLANTVHDDCLEQGRQAVAARRDAFPLSHALGIIDARTAEVAIRQPRRRSARDAWQLSMTERWIRAQTTDNITAEELV